MDDLPDVMATCVVTGLLLTVVGVEVVWGREVTIVTSAGCDNDEADWKIGKSEICCYKLCMGGKGKKQSLGKMSLYVSDLKQQLMHKAAQ